MKSSDSKVKFIARIEKHPEVDAAFIQFPYDVMKLYGVKGQVKVKAVFDGRVFYRGSLVKMGYPCHILDITQEVRQKLAKSPGDKIKVVIEQDLEIRVVIVPEDVKPLLGENPKAKKYFESLSYTDQKEYIRWIETAQREETRARRIGIFIAKLKEKKKFLDP